MSMYLLDEYVNVKAGEAFRLFPFGRLVKNGKERIIDAELAKRFRLPHFKPPIKLGSHNDDTAAGGHIVELEVREDGLYALPEYTDKGGNAVTEGDYRYHSPEVIWEGGLENPDTGDLIEGPLIVGDALLHMPHLGEQAALYKVEELQIEGGNKMETVEVPKGWFDKMVEFFSFEKKEPVIEPQAEPEQLIPEIDADEFEAAKVARDEYKAKLEQFEADKEKQARIDKFGAELKEAEIEIEEGAEMLASFGDEQAEWVLAQFKAMSKQIDTSELFSEKGTTGEALPEDPKEKLNAVVNARAEKDGIDYNSAFKLIQQEQPELFEGGNK